MRIPILLALIVAVGCAKKPPAAPPPSEDDLAAANVCKHIASVCGKNTSYEVCVSSAKAMRAANLEGAKEAELCALAKTTCQDISMCSMKANKKVIRTSLRRIDEKLEKVKQELDPLAPATSPPEPAPTPAPAPAK